MDDNKNQVTMADQEKIVEWAKRETGIAVMAADKEEEQKAIQAAYRGFKEMLNFRENADPMNWQICLKAMTQFMNEQPLSVITGAEGEWDLMEETENGDKYYVSNRLNTLYKLEHPDGTTEYNDVNRYLLLDVNAEKKGYFVGGLGQQIFNAMVPIEFPYFPIGRYKIFIEDFKCHHAAAENDTYGVLVIKNPEGKMMNVNRFFKKDYETKEWVEILKTEYMSRRKKAGVTGNVSREDS